MTKISNERFKVMERKLFFGIMTPGMIAALILGIWMPVAYDRAVYATAGLAAFQAGTSAGLPVFLGV
jgi:uncharacterized membrane protein